MKWEQTPGALFMVRPAAFGYNVQTAGSNTFQQEDDDDAREILEQSRKEFDTMTDLLKSHDIDTYVIEDTREPAKPDAIFPNNWISFHPDGKVILYPMMAENRRPERRQDVIETLKKDFEITQVIDLSDEEKKGKFLEGTGSMVFDHVNKIAYGCRSPRTNEDLFRTVCKQLGYEALLFDAVDEKGQAIYHTNVLMTIGSRFALVCLDAIRGEEDQERLLEKMASTNHKVVAISDDQMRRFAGNMIEVMDGSGEACVLVSEQAFQSLLPGQLDAITRFAEMIPVNVATIEKYGGGSVRCMVAGIHLKRKG